MFLHIATSKIKKIPLVRRKQGLDIGWAINSVGADKDTHGGHSGNFAVLVFKLGLWM